MIQEVIFVLLKMLPARPLKKDLLGFKVLVWRIVPTLWWRILPPFVWRILPTFVNSFMLNISIWYTSSVINDFHEYLILLNSIIAFDFNIFIRPKGHIRLRRCSSVRLSVRLSVCFNSYVHLRKNNSSWWKTKNIILNWCQKYRYVLLIPRHQNMIHVSYLYTVKRKLIWIFSVPPSFIIVPKIQEVVLNSRLELRCTADGIPTPTIHWKRNNVTIDSTKFIYAYFLCIQICPWSLNLKIYLVHF